jgi:hypothetical protein
MTTDAHHLVRLALAGLGDIEEWRLGDPSRAKALGYPRQSAAEILDGYGTVFVDVVLDAATGAPVCHEVNGPNAVGSDALTGESSLRASLEAAQATRTAEELGLIDRDGAVIRPFVTAHAHQHWSAFRTGGEFYPRVDEFAGRLADGLGTATVARRAASHDLGSEDVSVVMGDVPSVAAGLTTDATTGRFEYHNRPVVFLGNPNLIPELVRTGTLERPDGRSLPAPLRVFHAWRLVHIVHDKARQQRLLRGTGIRPLAHFEACSRDEAIDCATRFVDQYGPVVLKPNAASGGAGIHVVVPGMAMDEIAARVDAVVREYVAKYGPDSERTVFPIRGFEFVQSTGYPLEGRRHLWDLRFCVLFEPGRAYTFPVSMRLAPAPFDPKTFHLDRDQWISNVSGRQVTLLKSGMDDDALAAVGFTDELLDDVMTSCVHWTMNAWDASVRDGGSGSSVYEDDCELEDPSFYPRDRFSW